MSAAQAIARRCAVLEDGPAAWEQLAVLARQVMFGGKQVHDAYIVATMLSHGVRRVVTFNASDFNRFRDFIDIVVP